MLTLNFGFEQNISLSFFLTWFSLLSFVICIALWQVYKKRCGLYFRHMANNFNVIANTGKFFEALWRESIETSLESLRNLRGVEPGITVDFEPFSVEGLRCPLGPLLLQARLATDVTQKAVALASGYNLRNMSTVEKGGQEPGVMTALYMVAATGVDVGGFWARLQAIFETAGSRAFTARSHKKSSVS